MMSSFTQPRWPLLLAGYENAAPLSDELHSSNGIYMNEQTGVKSKAYDAFPAPLHNGEKGGFDVHVYYFQSNNEQSAYARQLHDYIRREFPDLRAHQFFDGPAGPHPVATFQVDLLSPLQFGAFVPWIAVYRGPCSVLVHPNTDTTGMDLMQKTEEEVHNHTDRAMWIGDKVPLDTSFFGKQYGNAKKRATKGGLGKGA
ncbi:DOPA-like domain-containing protein [Xylariales sp. AK1849]|nr:DOPA-like domain-containing protein [Xylariales sp. AK1849]